MDADKFLNLLATAFGALGAIQVMLSVLVTSPEMMLAQANGVYGSNPAMQEALANQKGDAIGGCIFIMLAFVLALIALVFVPIDICVFQWKLTGIGWAALISISLWFVLRVLRRTIARREKHEMTKIATVQYLNVFDTCRRITPGIESTLQVYARRLGIDTPAGESVRSLLGRIAAKVEMTLPPDLDFSAVEPQKPPTTHQ